MIGKWTWETAKTAYGAGIIVVKKNEKEWKVLGLWARGGYDIPKGHLEDGDDIFETALRETKEETGIEDLRFKWGKEPFREDNLFIFLAQTEQEPEVKKNVESGLYEHDHAKWLSWEKMTSNTYEYLKPSIKKAREIVYEVENC